MRSTSRSSALAFWWRSVAGGPCPRLRGAASVIRIDALWLAAEPVDMRTGAHRLLSRVVQVFVRGVRHKVPGALRSGFRYRADP